MDSKTEKKPELLVPAGSLEVLSVALRYGADAVYIGGEAYGLRAKARNFTFDEMRTARELCDKSGVRLYVTANIFAHEDDLAGIEEYFKELSDIKPDAVLIADPGVFSIAKRICPDIPVHISTQANNTNSATFKFWYDLGVRRVVAARELTLAEISRIRDEIPSDMEIECFVHGAMCISYSGRCLLSAYFTGRDANHGECTHPCRWNYAVAEATRPDEYMPVTENERGTFIFNSKDLCMIGYIPELASAGIGSLKIEGRMRNALYVATVARMYRLAIDEYFSDPKAYLRHRADYEKKVSECTHRPFGTGFYFGKPTHDGQVYDESTYETEYTYLGYVHEVTDDGRILIEQKNKFLLNDTIEVMKPNGDNIKAGVMSITDEKQNPMESAPHASQMLYLKLSVVPEEGDILRKQEDVK